MYGTAKKNASIYMYYVAPEAPIMSSVIAECPDLTPQYFEKSTPIHVAKVISRL